MEPNNFTQLYIHIVINIKNKNAPLRKEIRVQIFEYIGGIIKNLNQHPIAINGVEDHIHILYSMNSSVKISDTVKEIKRSASFKINREKLTNSKFSWQRGYGAFSYNQSSLNRIKKYIANQEIHHMKQNTHDEFKEILNKFNITYKEKYLFKSLNQSL